MTEVDEYVAEAVRRASGVHTVLGSTAEGIGWRGPVALVTCILPTRQANKVRSCMARAFREAFTKRSDMPVTTMSGKLDSGLPDGYVDAAQILRERGYFETHVWRLAGEFGRDLLLLAQDKLIRTMAPASYGRCDKEVCLYHRVDDSRLIEAALASFRERELHARVMADLPDPVAERQKRRVDEQGRGRKRARQTGEQKSRDSKQRDDQRARVQSDSCVG